MKSYKGFDCQNNECFWYKIGKGCELDKCEYEPYDEPKDFT